MHSMSTTRFLTGITTTGTPHLGNFVGSIRPSVAASRQPGVQSFYFLADYHALIKCEDPQRVQRSTLEIAASWLAAGLDPEQVTFYRQSDIPEIPELTWLLTCVTGKGLLNRAHAYKAANDKNSAAGREADAGVTAGLFMYPLLMGADILLFNAHQVPVGRDQSQHIEMARAMASSFNHLYGAHFVLPEAAIDEHVAILPGLDGRKMSKSYDNTIPLFSTREQLGRLIAGILTDSRAPGAPKQVEGSALFQIYQAFATPTETAALRQHYADGIAWGEVKQLLLDCVDQTIAPMRAQYQALLDDPARIEQTLLAGAERARALARPFMRELRGAVGLRSLVPAAQATAGAEVVEAVKAVKSTKAAKTAKTGQPAFKQYREADGKFYFKLVAADGRLLLQSQGFAAPRQAGQAIAELHTGAGALPALASRLVPVDGVDAAEVMAALQALAPGQPQPARK
ncbi:tryptophanyl-tRNA synthetase [Verminephrobacter eiseniae EF01-2]|uniref:Tryptophan--tRNA ligase n=2 Tax=Verminephrobacter eiseniae TaxID=364317 RepID=A1WIC4_VEREI|nr:tryptophanyl-tRNA synthetase [Verminephrobacter eiseniae EF01-2]